MKEYTCSECGAERQPPKLTCGSASCLRSREARRKRNRRRIANGLRPEPNPFPLTAGFDEDADYERDEGEVEEEAGQEPLPAPFPGTKAYGQVGDLSPIAEVVAVLARMNIVEKIEVLPRRGEVRIRVAGESAFSPEDVVEETGGPETGDDILEMTLGEPITRST